MKTGMAVTFDRAYGGFIGVALGDALGVPHEFRRMGSFEYTGILQHRLVYTRRFQPSLTLGVGQVSDDTEMSIALARSIVNERGWNRNRVVETYLQWANSGIPLMGKLTRSLFRGVKTIRGWESRHDKLASPDAQSNGSLMRSFPLAFVGSQYTMADIALTNPSHVNIDIGTLYVETVKRALRGTPAPVLWNYVISQRTRCAEIERVIAAIESEEDWAMTDTPEKRQKGWVVFPFYCAMKCLHDIVHDDELTFGSCMQWVIGEHPGSDTDTNAAVAGGLVGAIIGWEKMYQDEITMKNVNRILDDNKETDLPRPPEYSPNRIHELSVVLVDIANS